MCNIIRINAETFYVPVFYLIVLKYQSFPNLCMSVNVCIFNVIKLNLMKSLIKFLNWTKSLQSFQMKEQMHEHF